MPWSHHAYTDNTPEMPREQHMLSWVCLFLQWVGDDRQLQILTKSLPGNHGCLLTTWSFCQCSIQFCSTIMIHIYVLFYLVSNHFYNTHNLHPLAILTSAGLTEESCILAVVKKCTARGATGPPDKIYIIIFIIFGDAISLQLHPGTASNFFAKLGPGVYS